MRKRYDKRGWLKVMEAVIAVLIVLTAVLFIISGSISKRDISSIAYEKEKYILTAISKDDNLRAKILLNDRIDVNSYVSNMLPGSWGFETIICNINDICEASTLPRDRNVYSSEIVITSNLGASSKYEPKKLRMFVWIK